MKSKLRLFLGPWIGSRRAAETMKTSRPAGVLVAAERLPVPQVQRAPIGSGHGKMGEIARASVRLAALGPRLAQLAHATEEQANVQARTAEEIAGATSRLAQTLGRVVGELEGAAGNVHDAMRDIVRIAEQTRLISLNASIEAARAGEQGRAFAVVADEVKKLADETRVSTGLIEERVTAIHSSVENVTAIVGEDEEAREREKCVTMDAVDRQVRQMANTAGSQRDGAHELHGLSDQANTLTEELLLAVGTFRFAIHERAARDVELHVPSIAAALDDRGALEDKLQHWLRSDPCFELLYVTDARGRQIVSNIGRRDGSIWADPANYNCDWSRRPWFTEAHRLGGEVHVTDIYRSTATSDFCFTVSVAIRDGRGAIAGVLAADVNFQTLVTTEARKQRESFKSAPVTRVTIPRTEPVRNAHAASDRFFQTVPRIGGVEENFFAAR